MSGLPHWDLETTVVCFSRLHRLVAEKNKMWNLGYPAVQKTVEGGVEGDLPRDRLRPRVQGVKQTSDKCDAFDGLRRAVTIDL